MPPRVFRVLLALCRAALSPLAGRYRCPQMSPLEHEEPVDLSHLCQFSVAFSGKSTVFPALKKYFKYNQ